MPQPQPPAVSIGHFAKSTRRVLRGFRVEARSIHVTGTALGLGLLVGLGTLMPLAHGDARPTTISPAEIKDGMKGYGLTVFKGVDPERFDVEVVAVLHNFRPAQDLILVKTPHPRLNITKNVKGMSGSPIYLDGRLAGAYAYSLASFQAEPVAGVTPIAPMLAELHRPIPAGFFPLEGARGALPGTISRPAAGGAHAMGTDTQDGAAQDRRLATAPSELVHHTPTEYSGAPGAYDFEEHQRQIRDRFAFTTGNANSAQSVVPVATPLLVGGVGPRTQRYVHDLFAPLGLDALDAGGSGNAPPDASVPMHFVNGGALGISMVAGDISFFGLGTVTQVEGTKLTGFGHPMMEAGATSLPTAIGRVHWIFASDQHSMKVGESARPLGTLIQDRQSSVVADESVAPQTFPMTVQVEGAIGAPKTSWSMTVAEEKFMTPGLAASALSGVIEATTNERRDMSWRLVSKILVRGQAPVVLEDVGVASGGMPEGGELARTRLVRVIGDVLNNPWQNAHIDQVSATLSVQYTRDVWSLRSTEVLTPNVDPGEKVRLRVTLLPFSGPPVLRTLEVPLPLELTGRDVEIELIPGFEVVPEMSAPESLAQMLANAPKQVSARSLVAQVRLPSQGLTYQTHVAARLPAFAVDALRTQNSTLTPEAFTSYSRTIFPVERYVDGRDRVRVHVRAKVD